MPDVIDPIDSSTTVGVGSGSQGSSVYTPPLEAIAHSAAEEPNMIGLVFLTLVIGSMIAYLAISLYKHRFSKAKLINSSTKL